MDWVTHVRSSGSQFTSYIFKDINCETYLEQPGFTKTNEKGETLVCKLKKSLYGLKQSGRNWNNMLHKFLLDQDFTQSVVEPCLYTTLEGDTVTMILIWVDDLIIAASNDAALNAIKKSLKDRFKMKDIGNLLWFLGIELSFDSEGSASMNESKYSDRILETFYMKDCNPKPFHVI